jgi:hypothetical protein
MMTWSTERKVYTVAHCSQATCGLQGWQEKVGYYNGYCCHPVAGAPAPLPSPVFRS